MIIIRTKYRVRQPNEHAQENTIRWLSFSLFHSNSACYIAYQLKAYIYSDVIVLLSIFITSNYTILIIYSYNCKLHISIIYTKHIWTPSYISNVKYIHVIIERILNQECETQFTRARFGFFFLANWLLIIGSNFFNFTSKTESISYR